MKGKGILAIVGIVLITAGAIGIKFTYSNELEAVAEEKQIPEGDINDIYIKSMNTKVEVIATEDMSPKTELVGNNFKGSELEYDVDLTDGKLSIEIKERMMKLFSFDFRSTGLTLKVYVPDKEYKSLQAGSDNGEIDMENIHANDIDANTSNGTLNLENIKSSQLTLVTDNGQIHAKNLKTDSVNVETKNGQANLSHVDAKTVQAVSDNGEIKLTDVTGDITGETKNGYITLMVDDLERDMELETDNGKISIESKEKPENVHFDVEVDNGKVDILGEYEGTTVIGNGDHLIKLTSKNGSIVVE